MVCAICNESLRPNEAPSHEGSQVVCGGCVQGVIGRVQRLENERLSSYNGDRLRQLRLDNGWTQREVAFSSGVPAYAISQFERGKTICPEKLAKWLDTRLA